MIEAHGLTKRYGQLTAVDHLTFDVRPGVVTGFLGPNGSGKSTTMRLILGLDAPDHGTVTINGRGYHDLPFPLREVGALLEAKAFHPGRGPRAHLQALAASNAIPASRVDHILQLVGLSSAGQHEAANRKAGQLSLGMAQRLGIAAALLGDPAVLVLDEPVNGLDPEGIRWIRNLLKSLAAQGRTVLISSHLLAEAAQTVEDVVVIARGRLAAQGPVAELAAATSTTRIRTPDTGRLISALARDGVTAQQVDAGTVEVRGTDPDQVARTAAAAGVIVLELTRHTDNLEELFFDLTSDRADDRALEVSPS